jgi:uncharacterized membrane protein
MNVALVTITMYDSDDLPTLRYPALADSKSLSIDDLLTQTGDRAITIRDESPSLGSSLSSTLPISAEEAYALMSLSERIPEWMAVVRSARTLTRYLDGRPEKVAFIVNLQRASMGYTLRYSYDDSALTLKWATAPGAKTVVAGSARFQPLGPKACLVHYELELSKHSSLPAWNDEMYNGHPASSVLNDFRDFVQRTKDTLSHTYP